jgi:Ca2+-binding RTX toxin-like protein
MKTHSTIAIATLALLALTAAARPADAARLDVIGDVLTYTDPSIPPGIANALSIMLSGDRYTIDDPAEAAIDLTANALAAGCTAVDSNSATCPASAVTDITVLTRNGDDRVVLTGVEVPAFVDGGHGNDTLVGGDADDFFFWQPGDGSDRIAGGRGVDTLEFSGSNVDEQITITADGTGFDLLRDVGSVRMDVQDIELLSVFTGEGTDSVVTTPLADTIQEIEDGIGEPDGLSDVLHVNAGQRCLTRRNDTFEVDGRPSITFTNFPEVLVENELCPRNVCDDAVVSGDCTVNHVRHQPCQGTAGDDLIVGTAAADVIRGGGGNDRIVGRAGDDLLCGEDGADVLLGGPGDDTLVGGAGGDRLDGGRGNDTLEGDDGDDVLTGGPGKDDLDGGTGEDDLRGGANSDTLRGGADTDTIDGGGSTDLCTDADQAGPFHHCEQP